MESSISGQIALQIRKYHARVCARPRDSHTACHRTSHALQVAKNKNKDGTFRLFAVLDLIDTFVVLKQSKVL